MIKNIKTYTLFSNITSNSFSAKFNFEFQPDEMIVKKIDFRATNPDDNLFFVIYTNLVNDYIGYSKTTQNPISNELQTRFKIRSPIQGNYDFSFRNINDELKVIDGEIIIFLEFIEYVK